MFEEISEKFLKKFPQTIWVDLAVPFPKVHLAVPFPKVYLAVPFPKVHLAVPFPKVYLAVPFPKVELFPTPAPRTGTRNSIHHKCVQPHAFFTTRCI